MRASDDQSRTVIRRQRGDVKAHEPPGHGHLVLSLAVTLLAPAGASAQLLPSFRDLALRVNIGDSVRIAIASGERISGRLTRLAGDEIAISTDVGERRFTSAAVREVAVRRRPSRQGVLFGAGIASAIGALAACVPADRSECADAPVVLGALGAGVGFALSGLAARTTPVYVWLPDATPSRTPRPPGRLEAVALRIDLDDWIRVEDQSGTKIASRLIDLTGEDITIDRPSSEPTLVAPAVRASFRPRARAAWFSQPCRDSS